MTRNNSLSFSLSIFLYNPKIFFVTRNNSLTLYLSLFLSFSLYFSLFQRYFFMTRNNSICLFLFFPLFPYNPINCHFEVHKLRFINRVLLTGLCPQRKVLHQSIFIYRSSECIFCLSFKIFPAVPPPPRDRVRTPPVNPERVTLMDRLRIEPHLDIS